jgi:hypothetical protein
VGLQAAVTTTAVVQPRHPSCITQVRTNRAQKLCKKSQFYAAMRKSLDSLILEVPLIVLQYYKKPSFLYIYIKKGLMKDNCNYLQFNFAKLLNLRVGKGCQQKIVNLFTILIPQTY